MNARNPTGHRIGEWHHKTKYSNEIVAKARKLREEKGYTYARIGMVLNVPWRTVTDWCNYATRYDG